MQCQYETIIRFAWFGADTQRTIYFFPRLASPTDDSKPDKQVVIKIYQAWVDVKLTLRFNIIYIIHSFETRVRRGPSVDVRTPLQWNAARFGGGSGLNDRQASLKQGVFYQENFVITVSSCFFSNSLNTVRFNLFFRQTKRVHYICEQYLRASLGWVGWSEKSCKLWSRMLSWEWAQCMARVNLKLWVCSRWFPPQNNSWSSFKEYCNMFGSLSLWGHFEHVPSAYISVYFLWTY